MLAQLLGIFRGIPRAPEGEPNEVAQGVERP
jgi:hypothetical protein